MIRRIGRTLVVIILFASCWGEDYSPKPRGYFNIEFPKKQYRQFDQGCAFTFDYPVYGSVEADSRDRPCWYNLVFSRFNGRLHLTYYDVTSKAEFESLAEDARTFAFKHTVKANAIDQKLINYPDKRVYGIYYAIEGNTASSIQFFLTDSAKHYFRGALYFSERPQFDSIQPVVEFIRVDIDRLIETFKWK
ncbi:gliding motility lipoprotein GldD [Pedobacter faecalis]|uniref:gliding motility lipoprotein GldD n=1 Tax=Pedobacter faecalis TaxID=3041495 RepID=UPI00254E2F26|nr:gliding motility lipoprotein GldD [Pedobacter sp. ELA7]